MDIIATLVEAVAKLRKQFNEQKALGYKGEDGLNGADGKDGIDGKDGQDGADGQDGIDGINGKNGKDGLRGFTGKDGINGLNGIDGKDGKDGEKGEQGDKGDIPSHEWSGTQLKFQLPNGGWGKAVDLRGLSGFNGGSGINGAFGVSNIISSDSSVSVTKDGNNVVDITVTGGGLSTITSDDGSIIVTQVGDTANIQVSEASPASTLLARVRNNTGATLTKGTVVYINGTIGQLSTVAKALATSDATSAQTLGMITADLANNTNGYVTVIGVITNINTSAYTDGQQLYLSPTIAGAVTATKPYAPQHLVYVGIVEHAHPTQGKIFVRVQNGFELDELHNVSAQSPSNGQIIIYNATTSLWEKNNLTAGTGISVTNGAGSITVANTSPMTYPTAGIPNSTGTAWGTSYGVTGTGSVVLSDAPSLTGAVTIGGTTDTATLTLGRSTASQTVNIATGATDSAEIKIVNIATNSNFADTSVNIGSASESSFITIAGKSNHNFYSFFQAGIGQEPITVSELPTGVTVYAGDRNFVSNANSPRVGSQVSGGGSTVTPVFYNGTVWVCDSGLGSTVGSGAVVLATNPSTADGATIQNTSQAINIGTTQSTGAITVGGTGATGAITLGQSTGAQNINISNGAATTSIVNIGGTTLSTGAINIGRSTGTQTISIGSGSLGATVTTGGTRTINIGSTSAGTGITNVTIGKTSSTVDHTTNINGRYINLNAGTALSLGSAPLALPIRINQSVDIVDNLISGVTGSRAFVTDALAPVFGSAVSGGGSTAVPVYYDG
jgi:hypothetical protein